MAHKICQKTAKKYKDCQLIEEEDIAKIINNTEVESFEIKQAWMDDMSAQLDAYNSQKSKPTYWWSLLLLIPIVALVIAFLPGSIENKDLAVINSLEKNELLEITDKNTNTTFQETNAFDSDSKESNQNIVDEDGAITNASSQLDVIPQQTKSSSSATTLNTTPLEKTTAKTENANTSQKNTGRSNLTSKTITDAHVRKESNSDGEITAESQNGLTENINTVISIGSQNETSNETLIASEATSNTKLNENLIDETANNTGNENNLHEGQQLLEKTNPAGSEVLQTPIETLPNNSETDIKQSAEQVAANNSTTVIPAKSQTKENTEEENSHVEPENTVSTTEVESTNSEPAKESSEENSEQEESTRIKTDDEEPKLWSIGITLGPDFLTKEITSNSDLLNFEQKKQEELFDNTWGYDFELSRQITPWLTLGTGVGFKKYKEVNSYSADTFITIDTSYRITDISFMYIDSTITDSVLIPNFLTVPVVKKDSIIDSSKQKANGTVTSSYVQIPINTQLTFLQTKKFKAYTNLGLNLGLLTKSTGVVLDYSTNNIVTYKTRKMIYNANVGLGFNYNLFGPIDYKLYGAYQFSLTNFSLTPNIDKRYNGFNLRTGLVFNF